MNVSEEIFGFGQVQTFDHNVYNLLLRASRFVITSNTSLLFQSKRVSVASTSLGKLFDDVSSDCDVLSLSAGAIK